MNKWSRCKIYVCFSLRSGNHKVPPLHGGIGEETCKEFTEERFLSIFENSEQCFSKGDNGQCRLPII